MKILVSLLIIAVIAINESQQCLGPRNMCAGAHHHRLPMEDYPQMDQNQAQRRFPENPNAGYNHGQRMRPPPPRDVPLPY
ncbi:unnamed protein product [Chironomus riparius]|uniref:Uncharacterized protein n=1 Tax=Chironomus riparius TaxID=315576 RepID=A0A9N9RQN9_9DIPT|nr:unnamed protein product [Chironomus riparius]